MFHEGVTQDAADKMNKASQFLDSSLVGIRGGAINAACLETVRVSYHGQLTPIWHLANVGDGKGRVAITPFDPTMLGQIVKALTDAGFNAYVCSKVSVAVSSNPMSGAEREKVKAQIKKLGEEAKIAVRGVRKQARQSIDGSLPKDDRQKMEVEIQKLTSQTEAKIDQMIHFKLTSLG